MRSAGDPWCTVFRRTHVAAQSAQPRTFPAAASSDQPRGVAGRPCTRPASSPARPLSDGSVWGRRRVLLLNSTYEPLAALPVRRAVVMLLCGKADVVHADPGGPVIHSATPAIAVPSVIQLSTFVRVPYRARVPLTRAG